MTLPPKTLPSPRAVPATPLPPSASLRTKPQPAPGTERRAVHIVMFAVIACGLLVAAAFVVGLPGKGGSAGSLHEAELEPGAYALQATGDVSRIAALPALPEADLAALSAADVAAQQELQAAIDGAIAALEAALADAALPALPEDYVPGAEVDVTLPDAQAYPLPDFQVPDLGVDALRITDVAGSVSPVGPRAGTPLDGVLGQVEGLQAQLEDLTGPLPLGELPGGVGPLQDLPIGGSSDRVGDANDAVDPDEQGALAASAHAQSMLGMTSGAYEATAADLEDLLALYEDLAQKVEDAIESVRGTQDEAEQAIADLLEDRLAAIESQVAKLEAQATKLVALHETAVAQAQSLATDAIDEALDAHSLEVSALGHAKVQDLTRQAAAIQADADQRKAEIEAIVQAAVTDLGSSAETAEALQAVQASAAAATLKVDRDAKAQVAALEQQADDVRGQVAQSQARLQAMAGVALDGVNGTVDEALAGDADVREYLGAVAQAQGVLMQARENEMALEAVAELQAMADGRVADLLEEGISATQSAEGVLDDASALVGQVEDLLVSEVGKDVGYVSDVAEDYGRVPTEERKARAAHWASTALGLGSVLDQAVIDGHGIEGLAEDVLDAASQAEAQIAAMA